MSNLQLDIEPKSNKIIAAIDFIIRGFFFIWYMNGYLGLWFFLAIQVGLFIVELVIREFIITKFKRWIKKQLNPKYKNDLTIEVPMEISGERGIFYMIVGIIVSFIFFKDIIEPQSWYMYLIVGLIAIISSISFLIVSAAILFPISFAITSYEVKKSMVSTTDIKQFENVTKDFPDLILGTQEEIVLLDTYDENDSKIAKLESSLKSINSRVDAYMLESVLLGALAFSGFLTIIASNIIANKDQYFSEIILLIKNMGDRLIKRDVSGIDTEVRQLFNDNHLFILIMFESLMCSVFFILVLALRLRFSDLSLKLDYLIRIMNIFNAKEEELINIQLTNPSLVHVKERHQRLSKKISIALKDSDKLYKEIKPIVDIMGLYRNLGIFTFYLILATSGLYFSYNLSIVIISFALLTVLFRIIEKRMKFQKITNLLKRH